MSTVRDFYSRLYKAGFWNQITKFFLYWVGSGVFSVYAPVLWYVFTAFFLAVVASHLLVATIKLWIMDIRLRRLRKSIEQLRAHKESF